MGCFKKLIGFWGALPYLVGRVQPLKFFVWSWYVIMPNLVALDTTARV